MGSSDEPSRALPVEPGAQPLAALIARVEAARPWGNGDLNGDILRACGYEVACHKRGGRVRYPGEHWQARPSILHDQGDAIRLVERRLPGCWWLICKGRMRGSEPLYGAQLLFGSDEVLGAGEHEGAPALAIILALLRALQAQPNRHNARDGASPQSNELSNAK